MLRKLELELELCSVSTTHRKPDFGRLVLSSQWVGPLLPPQCAILFQAPFVCHGFGMPMAGQIRVQCRCKLHVLEGVVITSLQQ
jgi:hypothetical protein